MAGAESGEADRRDHGGEGTWTVVGGMGGSTRACEEGQGGQRAPAPLPLVAPTGMKIRGRGSAGASKDGQPGCEESDKGQVSGCAGVLVRGAALADCAHCGLHYEGRRGPIGEALAEVHSFCLSCQSAEFGPDGGAASASKAL